MKHIGVNIVAEADTTVTDAFEVTSQPNQDLARGIKFALGMEAAAVVSYLALDTYGAKFLAGATLAGIGVKQAVQLIIH